MDLSACSARSALYVVIPGDLETRTGGYGYDRRIIAGLRDRGWLVEVRRLDDSFPIPTPTARDHSATVLAAIPDSATVLMDGLALGALPEEVEREAARLAIVALVHHPLAAETGIAASMAAAFEVSERRALAAVHTVVVTSRATAACLAAYGVGADRITVVEPGTDPAPLARGSTLNAQRSALYNEPSTPSPQPSDEPSALSPQPFGDPSALSPEPCEIAILCVATLTPRKGHELLLSALAAIPQRNWRLTCAGSLERDAPTVARVRARLRADGLEDRVSLVGDLDAATLAEYYDRADLFVLPTLHEGYGMAVAEAIARGLPVVATATGAIADLVIGGVRLPRPEPRRRQPDQPSGLVVPPGDLPALTDALSRVLGDSRLRAQFAAGARGVRNRLPTWDAAIAAMARALERAART